MQLQPCKRSLLHGRRDKSIDLLEQPSHHVQDPGSTPLRFTTLRVSSLLCFRSRLRTAYCGTEKSSFVGFLCLQGKTSFFFFFFYATVTLLFVSYIHFRPAPNRSGACPSNSPAPRREKTFGEHSPITVGAPRAGPLAYRSLEPRPTVTVLLHT